MSIFFGLEKEHDTAWRYGILRDLESYGVCGSMLNTIEIYFSERNFSVRVGTLLSRTNIQENGVQKGGVLSCTLFIVKMNSIQKALPPIFSTLSMKEISKSTINRAVILFVSGRSNGV